MAGRRAGNTNRQGANFELQIMHDLERFGYVAHRSSGSHGAVDVVAVGDLSTLVIQAKISQPIIPPKERAAVLALADRMGGRSAVPMVAYRISGKVMYRVLTGPGPKDFLLWEPEPLRYAPCDSCGHLHGMHGAGTGCWAQTGDVHSCGCVRFALKVRG